jgi:threonine dehydratase
MRESSTLTNISDKSLSLETTVRRCPLNLANIENAAQSIDPIFLHSAQYEDGSLNAALRRRVLVKVETANPIRSFKGRGADFFARSLDPTQKIVCASAGNFGQAMAYVGRSRGIPVEVFVARDVNPAKAERMRALGAKVTLCDGDFDVAKMNARQLAADHRECIFVEDGAEDAITEGAGTIGVELLAAGTIDAVVVPLGDGALITGVAAWIKDRSPGTQIIGVCPKATPAMLHAWREARGMPQIPQGPHALSATGARSFAGTDVNQPTQTIADGIEVRVPVRKSVEKMKNLVDDIVLVNDDALIEAMRLSASVLGLVIEPSGAAGLAAIRHHELLGERLATILTGSNIHPQMLAKLVDSAR